MRGDARIPSCIPSLGHLWSCLSLRLPRADPKADLGAVILEVILGEKGGQRGGEMRTEKGQDAGGRLPCDWGTTVRTGGSRDVNAVAPAHSLSRTNWEMWPEDAHRSRSWGLTWAEG